ncbi:hypothetical protein ABIE27_000712 [Paenibacillus sp. 4624]
MSHTQEWPPHGTSYRSGSPDERGAKTAVFD